MPNHISWVLEELKGRPLEDIQRWRTENRDSVDWGRKSCWTWECEQKPGHHRHIKQPDAVCVVKSISREYNIKSVPGTVTMGLLQTRSWPRSHSCQPFRFWRNSSAFYTIFRHSDRNDQILPKLKNFGNANTMDKDYVCARRCIC